MRIRDLPVEEMTPEQRSIRDDIVAGPRGKLQGPLKVWLTSPSLADKSTKSLDSFADMKPLYLPI